MLSFAEAKITRLFRLSGRHESRHRLERLGFTLYTQAVAAARSPVFYTTLAVADTLDGRFDMICLHVSLLSRRLGRPPAHPRPGPGSPARSGTAPLAQAVFDAMFTDMDGCLREAGVGDLGVPRRVRAMWEAYNGRSRAYGDALDRDDAAALSEALWRNIWRGRESAERQAGILAGWVMRQQSALAAQADAELHSGVARFLEMPSVGCSPQLRPGQQ